MGWRCRAQRLFSRSGTRTRSGTEYGVPAEDLNQFASKWLAAEAAQDLPKRPLWHFAGTTMTTAILGCQIEVVVRGGIASALLGEAIIGFFEAFYSTAIRDRRLVSPRERLLIEVRQSVAAAAPFVHRPTEDECGETTLIVSHPVLAAADLVGAGFEERMFELFARVTAELQLDVELVDLEGMFSKYRAQDRAFHVARLILAVTNVLGDSPPGQAEDWVRDDALADYPRIRQTAWVPSMEETNAQEKDVNFSADPPPEHLFGADAVLHRHLRFTSPIVLPLWDKARWKGLGVAPLIGLSFGNFEVGKQIFRGWRKKVGAEDREGWLGITVFTGIRRDAPLEYRVAIGVSEAYMKTAMAAVRYLCSATGCTT